MALVARLQPPADVVESTLVRVNGQPGRVVRGPGEETDELTVWSVLTVDVIDGRIQTIRVVRNPDKLRHLSAHA